MRYPQKSATSDALLVVPAFGQRDVEKGLPLAPSGASAARRNSSRNTRSQWCSSAPAGTAGGISRTSAGKIEFDKWTRSEAFRAAHRDAGSGKSLTLSHPEFEGFEAIQVVKP